MTKTEYLCQRLAFNGEEWECTDLVDSADGAAGKRSMVALAKRENAEPDAPYCIVEARRFRMIDGEFEALELPRVIYDPRGVWSDV